MINPLFKTNRNVILVGVALFILFFKQFSTLYFIENIAWHISLFDSLISIIIFALLSIALWNNIKYSKAHDSLNLSSFMTYLVMVWIFSLIWVTASYAICNDIFFTDNFYLDFLKRSLPWRFLIAFFLFSNAATLYLLLLYNDSLREKQKAEVQLLEKVKESELNMLKSQINPHFLFNSLHSISSLTITDPDKAQEMVIKLSDYLRYSISFNDIKLQEFYKELANIERYLEIEKVRFGEKLQYRNDISPECLKASIPLMLLQPLYENAIKHGVYESSTPILIETKAIISGNLLLIEIKNNFEKPFTNKKGAGIGLSNIRERLHLTYGSDTLLTVNSSDGVFLIKLLIPQLI